LKEQQLVCKFGEAHSAYKLKSAFYKHHHFNYICKTEITEFIYYPVQNGASQPALDHKQLTPLYLDDQA
jgi:hypothetical protein